MTDHLDGCAVDASGNLKDASTIQWYNDVDDTQAIATSAADSSKRESARKEPPAPRRSRRNIPVVDDNLQQTDGHEQVECSNEGLKDLTANQLGDDGLFTDVYVADVTPSNKTPCVDATRDIQHFFGPAENEKDGKSRRKCICCKAALVDHHTTLRRHMQSHQALYHHWCKKNNFTSKLPDDIKKRKEEEEKKSAVAMLRDTTLDNHLQPIEKPVRAPPYSHALFRKAAAEWLIATDQPLQALEHPAFQKMIECAGRAVDGIVIPGRNLTRETIMEMFKQAMTRLRDRLHGSQRKGDINATCDAWQASNTDGYVAVTGHWVEEDQGADWELQHALFGFVQMNTSHNGKRLGQALFKVFDRLDIVHLVGHVTCDNASNNDTMLQEFARLYELKTGRFWDVSKRRVRCLAHVINLATQALISTRSKAKYYNPHLPDDHVPDDLDGIAGERDELGLLRAIAVKAKSSAQRKQLLLSLQETVETIERPLLIFPDMPVRWCSTQSLMVRGEELKAVLNLFVYEIAKREQNLAKRRKLDALHIADEEWENLSSFIDVLSYADEAQQAFSAETGPTLHNAIPALEAIHYNWSELSEDSKYVRFHEAIDVALDKVKLYYDKMADIDAQIIVMVLHPRMKMKHVTKHWAMDDQHTFKKAIELIFKSRYEELHTSSVATSSHTNFDITSTAGPLRKRRRLDKNFKSAGYGDWDLDSPNLASSAEPWQHEYDTYFNTHDVLPENMGIVKWWGRNKERYPTWASLARDYLSVMGSSVSSERAFSSAGITISKRRNRLKGDIVEALQCLKCLIKNDLLFREFPTTEKEKEEYYDTEERLPTGGDSPTQAWDEIIIDEEEENTA